VVSCGSDVARWAPLERERHRVLWQPMPCRPCAHRVCPTDHGCAWGLQVAQVVETLCAGATVPAKEGNALHG